MLGRGEGRSLGAAVTAALRDCVPGARGWHAQLRALTATRPGALALERAGLNVTLRTLLAWLSDAREPTRRNQEIIARAYYGRGRRAELLARFLNADALITGLVETERGRPRYRGRDEAPLLIDHSEGDWTAWGGRLLTELLRGVPDPKKVQDYYIQDVILEDLSFSYLEFPGNHYEVEIV